MAQTLPTARPALRRPGFVRDIGIAGLSVRPGISWIAANTFFWKSVSPDIERHIQHALGLVDITDDPVEQLPCRRSLNQMPPGQLPSADCAPAVQPVGVTQLDRDQARCRWRRPAPAPKRIRRSRSGSLRWVVRGSSGRRRPRLRRQGSDHRVLPIREWALRLWTNAKALMLPRPGLGEGVRSALVRLPHPDKFV